MTFRVLIADYAWSDLAMEREILSAADAEIVEPRAVDEAAITIAARSCDAIMTNWAKITPGVIDAAGDTLKIVSRMGIGLDNIDIPHATSRGVVVTNVPDYCVDEVAEHAIAMLLTMARNVAFFHEQTKRGIYDLSSGPPMRRLSHQTLGIIGFGLTGQATAQRAVALGLTVLATNRSEKTPPAGVTMTDLDTLLTRSDFVSLHVPMVPETKYLIGADQLAIMKPSACLVNTARGGVIDTDALEEFMRAGGLRGVALDVHDPEPPDLSRPLFRDPRVIANPHAAFVSEESLAALRTRAARQVVDRLNGRTPENVRNPSVLRQ